MNQIRCPKCGEVFTIDESSYDSIVDQIKKEEIEKEVKNRISVINDKTKAEVELLKKKYEDESKPVIQELQDQIKQLKSDLAIANNDKDNALKTLEASKDKELSEALSASKIEIAELKNQIKANEDTANTKLAAAETEKELAVNKAVAEVKEAKDAEVAEARQRYEMLKVESDHNTETLKLTYEEKLANKDKELAEKQTQVDYFKDLKTRMSTKMLGETLEQHCSTEFNRNRMGMFPKAYFEKDNDIKTGSKGDFIFRDYDEDGTEIISIMFEMKNEADTTATKHKNEDFFKELDKDRTEKGCEYAILVSMLESDSELYNEGIVDVSYRYPKMYVIRPQFFIPIITLLRNASLKSIDYKKQLILAKSQDIDLSNFEENINTFKTAFSKNYESASKKFNDAITEIDKSIEHLNKIKDALLSSDRQLRLANYKAQDITVKKLTKNAPSVWEKMGK